MNLVLTDLKLKLMQIEINECKCVHIKWSRNQYALIFGVTLEIAELYKLLKI